MSFAKADDVMRIINELVRRIWRRAQHTALSIIPKLTYGMAMTSYGSDKPDLRYYHSRVSMILYGHLDEQVLTHWHSR